MRALVVLPTYQEAENIAEVLRRLRAAAPAADVLVVDDSSPDGTAAIAKAAGHELGGVDVLVRPAKAGLGSAYRAGFAEGLARGYDILVEMDSDLSHDPARLPALLRAVEAGADLAVGSRYVPGGGVTDWGLGRRLVSRGGSLYARLLLGVPVNDLTGGFKCFRRAVLEQLDLTGVGTDGYGFQIEMTYRTIKAGFRVTEVPILFRDRRVGASKMSAKIALEAFWKVPGLRFRVRS